MMGRPPDGLRLVFEDDFDTPDLKRATWLPHYLPAWSSRAASAATYGIENSCLHLSIPPEQGLWCADDHQPPLRVSGIQSGISPVQWAAPSGSSRFGLV